MWTATLSLYRRGVFLGKNTSTIQHQVLIKDIGIVVFFADFEVKNVYPQGYDMRCCFKGSVTGSFGMNITMKPTRPCWYEYLCASLFQTEKISVNTWAPNRTRIAGFSLINKVVGERAEKGHIENICWFCWCWTESACWTSCRLVKVNTTGADFFWSFKKLVFFYVFKFWLSLSGVGLRLLEITVFSRIKKMFWKLLFHGPKWME